jgi:hypothetical protein
MRTADVLRRIEAWSRGVPVPVGETLPWPRVEPQDRLIVAFVRMSGEARPWGVAAGRPGEEPTILTATEPRDMDELAKISMDFAKILLPHVPHPEHASDEEKADVAAVARRRQLWMPGPTHVEMLHLIDYRYSTLRARDDANARELGKLGRACGWLFRESTRPGQVRVLDATARLREAFAIPAEDVRQAHLGFVLAWIETSGSREARIEAARAAELESVGVTMSPDYEEKRFVALLKRWTQSRQDAAAQAEISARVREALVPELVRRYRLTERAILALEGGRGPNPELASVLDLSAEEHAYQYWAREQKAAEPSTDPDAPRFLGAHPESDFLPTQAAARFFMHAHAAEVASATLLHGDAALVEKAIDAGDALRGTIERVVNEGEKRKVVPVWTIRASAEGSLRLREESPVCVVGLRGRTGKVRRIAIEHGERVVEVEIDGWKKARENAPAADAKELEGTRVVLANAGVVGISKRKSMGVWDASGPGAWLTHAAPPPEPSVAPPITGDLVDLVEKLGGA